MQPRWQATIQYRADHATVDVVHDLEEIADLHDLVERGPHWDTIIKIEVVRASRIDGENLTLEQARSL